MVTINIQKKDLWLLAAVVVFLTGGVYVIAYGSNNPQLHGHDASEAMVNIGGVDKTLQQAINDGDFSGSSSPTNCVWESANRYGSNTKDGYYIAGISLGGCGRSGTAGCVSSIYWCQ